MKITINENQHTLLKTTFEAIRQHGKDTKSVETENHIKELRRLIRTNMRFGESLESAVDIAYWAVIEGIDVENRLTREA